jgi:hypothetical protein
MAYQKKPIGKGLGDFISSRSVSRFEASNGLGLQKRKRMHQPSFIPAFFLLVIYFIFLSPFPIKAGNENITRRGNLSPPVIQSPVDGAQYKGKTLEFKWRNVEGTSKYHIQIAEDIGFYLLQDERKDVRGETYILYNFGFKTYYFRVSCIDEDGFEGEWSDTVLFIMMPFSP